MFMKFHFAHFLEKLKYFTNDVQCCVAAIK